MSARVPAVQYAPSPDGKIAYSVLGEGPLDLVLMTGGAWNLDLLWEQPRLADYLGRLASFSRLIVFAPRGYALSDPFPLSAPPSLEEWALDIRWVMDAAGSERASVIGVGEVAPFILLAAATCPARVDRLVLLDGTARISRAEDYPIGQPPAVLAALGHHLVERWGTGELMSVMVPDLAEDPAFLSWAARSERATMSPATVAYVRRTVADLDVRGVLPSVQARTLVVSHAGNTHLGPPHGRYLSDHLPHAEYVERPGYCGFPWFHDADWTLDAIERFLTGTRTERDDLDDRVLATVLFTDIVDSTRRAAELGDSRWRRLLDEHNDVVRRQVERYRGEFIASTGDGVLATFDGPARAIRCALALRDTVQRLGLEIRSGLHTGEVLRTGDDIRGIAVAIGARVMAEAGPGQVLVSGSVPPLVAGSGLEFNDVGVRPLKGVPGEWRLHAVS